MNLFNNDLLLNVLKTINRYDVQDSDGNTILHHVIESNDLETTAQYLALLVLNMDDWGKNRIINIKNNQGDTPLHIAVRNNNENMIEMLIESGANVNIKNNNGERVEYYSDDNQQIPIEELTNIDEDLIENMDTFENILRDLQNGSFTIPMLFGGKTNYLKPSNNNCGDEHDEKVEQTGGGIEYQIDETNIVYGKRTL